LDSVSNRFAEAREKLQAFNPKRHIKTQKESGKNLPAMGLLFIQTGLSFIFQLSLF
jgi:hypothetical protein